MEALSAGSRVEARYNGGREWFPGEVLRVGRGKTSGSVYFTIRYDDGEVEEGVRRLRVRREGRGETEAWRLVEGMEVDVQLGNTVFDDDGNAVEEGGLGAYEPEPELGERCYKTGVVMRVHRDGRYDVELDDGEPVAGVPRERLAAQCEAAGGLRAPGGGDG
eukprot:g4224.t1